MSTSVLVKGILRRSSPVTAARPALRRRPAELATPVLQDRCRYHHGDEGAGRQAHGDGVPREGPPILRPRQTVPAQGLLGEVHPERGDHRHRDDAEEPRLGPGPFETLEDPLGALLRLLEPLRDLHRTSTLTERFPVGASAHSAGSDYSHAEPAA